MLNILKSDFFKLKKNRSFWVCVLVCIAFGVLMVVAMQVGMSRAVANPNDPEFGQMVDMISKASGVWALEYFLPMGFHIMIVGIFVAIFISSEFSFGTIKNTLSRGADRAKVFFSKFLVCSSAALVMLFMFIIAILTAGSIVWGYDINGIATFSSMLGMVSLQSLVIVAYTALFTFVSMTIRANGGAIATNIICTMMASTLLGAISMLFGGNINLSDYWLEWAASKLATLTPASGDVMQGIIIAVAWGIASILIGTVLFKKQDVK